VNEGPTRARSATAEDGGGRNRERPPAPEPLPHPVVDNHCHLDIADGEEWFTTDDAIAAASAVGVTRIVQIGCDLPGARWAVEAARSYDALVAAVALHPNEAPRQAAAGTLDDAMAEIEELAAAHDKVRAVGETGLDHFRTGEDGRAAQVESLRRHIDLAKRLDKALVIHDRDAHDEVLAVLDDEGVPDRWVMHCFSGDAAFARACLDRGAHLSFAGTVTFKNAQPLRDALAVTPRDRVLVETDAPFLTPTPYRGRPNASYLVPLTMRLMAEVRGEDQHRGGVWGRLVAGRTLPVPTRASSLCPQIGPWGFGVSQEPRYRPVTVGRNRDPRNCPAPGVAATSGRP
jgi:TatD DNase family protein